MKQKWNSNDHQGRSKEQIERNYMGMRIFFGFVAVLVIILITYSLVKFIAE
jgi:heme/copper-type cytochrome/quinol oxidase subunit 2